jgi:hypothetical protein
LEKKNMLRKIVFWVLAVVITLAAAIYQKETGPSYPAKGRVEIDGQTIGYALPRSHNGAGGESVTVEIGQLPMRGVLHYKKFKVDEPFTLLDMTLSGDSLTGLLPHQPPAGKLEYYVQLIDTTGNESIFVPGPQTIVIRFTGEVPRVFLITHIFLMFFGMLWSNRTGLEALSSKGHTKNLTLWTTVILFVGGLIFGPIVQKYAFGALWTGAPFGWDLTDNKTLIFVLIWALALWRHRYNPNPRYFVLAAALITIGMYLIPHSVLGSELDYTTGEVVTG